jgi:hypothetical protein
VGQGLLRLAAEQQAGYAAPAVRARDDEIAILGRGRVENPYRDEHRSHRLRQRQPTNAA